MLFRSFAPGSPLTHFIENLWLYEGYESPGARERIFPSGTFELVFNLRHDEIRIYKNAHVERCERFSGAIVSGPYRDFFLSDAAEESAVMGVHFKPGGAYPFLGTPAHELADRHMNLEDLWGTGVCELLERLRSAVSPTERFRLMENFLRTRLTAGRRHSAVSFALDAFARDGGRRKTRSLASESGLSEKRFIDVFKEEVGLTPKSFHRILRFHRVLLPLYRGRDPDWAELAVNLGYFDQSHLIRDFIACSGLSPEDHLRQFRILRAKGARIKFNHLPLSR